jgi:hypothetical protein
LLGNEVDPVAPKLFKGSAALHGAAEYTDCLTPTNDGTLLLDIDGVQLERWLAKSFVNMLCAGYSLNDGAPPVTYMVNRSLVDFIFNGGDLEKPFGLWLVAPNSSLARLALTKPPGDGALQMGTKFELMYGKWRHIRNGEEVGGPYLLPLGIIVSVSIFTFVGLFNCTSLGDEVFLNVVRGTDKNLEAMTKEEVQYRPIKSGYDHIVDGKRVRPNAPSPSSVLQFNWT